MRAQLALVKPDYVASTTNGTRPTLRALTTRPGFAHVLDGDADIAECEFESDGELPVAPEPVRPPVDDHCVDNTPVMLFVPASMAAERDPSVLCFPVQSNSYNPWSPK